MTALFPILLALNIVAASVSTPTFVAGIGLGSGAGGSSFVQKINKSSESDVKAALAIFKESCDEAAWTKAKRDPEIAYPKTEAEIKVLFEKAKNIGLNRFNTLCKPLKKGKAGIVFTDPISNEINNGTEMFHLFASHWDRRSLTSIYYLYQKRFSAKGYQVECSFDGKTSPIMTLGVVGGYMDEQGKPTGLAKTGIEDDKSAGKSSGNYTSPHARGQGVDVKTFGCTIITGENTNVIANQIAIGQKDKMDLSRFTGQALSSLTNSSSSEVDEALKEGLEETKANNTTFQTAGIDAAERAGIGALLIASGVADPDSRMEILPGNYSSTNQNNASPVSFEEYAGQIIERSYEKQRLLPPGSLKDGPNLLTIGRASLFDQSAIAISSNPSSEELQKAFDTLSVFASPDVAVLVPREAIALLKTDHQLALKIIGAYRLNLKFQLGYSIDRVVEMARSGITGADLESYLERDKPTSAEEKDLVKALANGGYKELKNKLDEIQQGRDQTAPGEFINILKNSRLLDEEEYKAVKDFLEVKEWRTPALQRLENARAPQAIIDWVKKNANINDVDAGNCADVLADYWESDDPKEDLGEDFPSIYETVIRSSIDLMNELEKAVFQSIFGANFSGEDLRTGFASGKLDQAAKAYAYSQALQKLGLTASQTTYLGVGLSENAQNESDGTISHINKEVASAWGVKISKNEIALEVDGTFPALKKLAIGSIAFQTKIPVQKVDDYFNSTNKDASVAQAISVAFAASEPINDELKEVLAGVLNQDVDKGAKLHTSIALAGADVKAQALANAGATGETREESEKDRENTYKKLESIFDRALELGKETVRLEGRLILLAKGLNEKEADLIIDGYLKEAEEIVTNSVLAKQIVSELPDQDLSTVKRVLSGRGTLAESMALEESMTRLDFSKQGIFYEGNLSQRIREASPEELDRMAEDFGRQSGAFILQREVKAIAEIDISRDQALAFMNNQFNDITDENGASTISAWIKSATGKNISDEDALEIYQSLMDEFDSVSEESDQVLNQQEGVTVSKQSSQGKHEIKSSAKIAALPSESEGGLLDQYDQNNAPTVQNPTAPTASDPPPSQYEPPQGVGGVSRMTEARQSAEAQPAPRMSTRDKIVSRGRAAFNSYIDPYRNIGENIRNLPENIVDYYQNFDYNAAISNVAVNVILNKLIGEKLYEMDPTGGILASMAMNYATSYIMSLGISMPVLLAIALIIDFKGTIQALVGMVKMMLSIFTDPVGFIMGFLGIGKKKPKAKAAARNTAEATQNDSLNGQIVDSPIDPPANMDPNPGRVALAQRVYAADPPAEEGGPEETTQAPTPVQATSSYVPAKKPSEKLFKKISRRTTDQVIEDLLLYNLAVSADSKATESDPQFLEKHWNKFMEIENPKSKSYIVRQIMSPRAVLTAEEKIRAKAIGMTDVLFDDEGSGHITGYKHVVNLARLSYGDEFLPSAVTKRASGLLQNRSVKGHVHFSF